MVWVRPVGIDYVKKPNERCLHGLHFDYFLVEPTAPEELALHFQGAFGENVFRLEERLGPRPVIRLVLKFVMELRIGESNNQFALIHRMSANQERREETERLVEETLKELAGNKRE